MSTRSFLSAKQLAAMLATLQPADRALLEIAVRRRLDPEQIAEMLGRDVESVVRMRDVALERLAIRIGLDPGELDQVAAWLSALPAELWMRPGARFARVPAHATTRRHNATAPPTRAAARRSAALPKRAAAQRTARPRKPPAAAPRRKARPRHGEVRRRRAAASLAALAALTALAFAIEPGGRHAVATKRTVAQPHVKTQDTGALLPGMPAPIDPHDVYAADRAGMLSSVVRGFPERVYVPNTESNTVDVIDPATYKVVNQFTVGALPQHVVPSYDMRTLWVANDYGNTLTAIDPASGRAERTVPVSDPYNLYFTPDGRYAIVVAEALRRLDFRDARTMRLHRQLSVPCPGVDHMDFTADGRYLLASCEFGGQMLVVDVASERVSGVIPLRQGGMPQDVKLSPDGRFFYVADMMANGLWLIDAHTFRKIGFLPTGQGAHGLYVSRDSRYLYVSNRGEGTISVVSFASRSVVRRWTIPGGGSPDMGGVSADGRVLWLTGRYNAEVYAISTVTGRLLARIPVGSGPHGLSIYPQPGRYSLGHTGIFR